MVDGIDVTPDQDGGVLKEIKRAGSVSNNKPWTGDKVNVHYVGTLLDTGEVFDSSRDRGEQFSFTIGRSEVIKGWDLGVASMTKGEVAVFTIKSEYAYGPSGSPPKIPGGATLVFEIELFDFCGEDITRAKDKSVVKRVKESGEGFDHPNDGGLVTCDFVGVRNGVVFDQREDVTFVVGEGADLDIPKGFEQALEKMRCLERAQITLSQKGAFGSHGCEKLGVPPNDDHSLVYDIYLKSFERAKESWQMNGGQKLEQSRLFREKGTEFFKAGKVSMAENKYRKIIELLEHEISLKDQDEEERRVLLQAGRLNLSMCLLKQEEWVEARDLCGKVIDENNKAAKAYFRRGECYLHLNDLELARNDYMSCLEIEPDNKAVRNKISFCNGQIKHQKSKERRLFSNMFDKFAEQDLKKEMERKRKEKPLEINEWEKDASERETLSVGGDITMDLDLNKELDKQHD